MGETSTCRLPERTWQISNANNWRRTRAASGPDRSPPRSFRCTWRSMNAIQRRHASFTSTPPLAAAASCLEPVERVLRTSPASPYFLMRVGNLPLIPYRHPGSPRLGTPPGVSLPLRLRVARPITGSSPLVRYLRRSNASRMREFVFPRPVAAACWFQPAYAGRGSCQADCAQRSPVGPPGQSSDVATDCRHRLAPPLAMSLRLAGLRSKLYGPGETPCPGTIKWSDAFGEPRFAGNPIAIVALSGWADAGNAGSDLVQHLIDRYPGEEIAL